MTLAAADGQQQDRKRPAGARVRPCEQGLRLDDPQTGLRTSRSELRVSIERREDELIDELCAEVGPEHLLTKMDTVNAAIMREFRVPNNRARWERILLKIAERVGVLRSVPETPQAVAAARERTPKPRWEMLAAMVYGNCLPRSVERVQTLYALGSGHPADQSWTGRGTHPSGYRL